MANNSDKSKARSLMDSVPSLKYTQALRAVQSEREFEHAPFGKPQAPGMRGSPSPAYHWLPLGRDATTQRPVGLFLFRNLIVSGPAGCGATTVMRAMSAVALDQWWRVEIITPKGPDYLEVGRRPHATEYYEQANIQQDEQALNQSVSDIITALQPGNSKRPLLLVLDSFAYYGEHESSTDPLTGWRKHLLELMDDEYTAVIIRVQQPLRSRFGWVLEHATNRLVMGQTSLTSRHLALAEAWSRDEAWRKMIEDTSWPTEQDRGAALFWDGQFLRKVHADPSGAVD